MATQTLSAQAAEGKATGQKNFYSYRLTPEIHGAILAELSQYAGTLEDISEKLDVLGDNLLNLEKTPEAQHTPDCPVTDNSRAKSSLEPTKPLDDLVHEIMNCAGVCKLMTAHIVGCSCPDTEELLSSGLSMLTERLEDIAEKYDTGELRNALLKAGGHNG
jgi:hypothetical protein